MSDIAAKENSEEHPRDCVISQFAHAIQRKIISRDIFGLIADCTTDISTSEQFSCGLQYVDSNLESHCDFLGFYKCPDTTAETLFRCVKDLFMRLNIPICLLQGYCFDGGRNVRPPVWCSDTGTAERSKPTLTICAL